MKSLQLIIYMMIFSGMIPGGFPLLHGQSAAAPIPLFNGENLEGWYTFLQYRGRDNDPEGVFEVKDGMIHISGTEYGCITTEEEYENYHLVVEYMYDEDHPESPAVTRGVARDGGVLLHSQGRDGAYS